MDQQLIRQGDVLVIPVDTIPTAAVVVPRDAGRVVLAYGEVTGHAHAIVAPEATLSISENERFLRIVGSALVTLDHEEHTAIAIAPGTYRVIRQREWSDADEPVYVAD